MDVIVYINGVSGIHQTSADPSLPDIPLPEEQCGPVRCHQHARCIDKQQGLCQCLPGFRGDGQVRCEDDPCARCLQNEVCVNDVCRPTGVNLCEGIRCGKQAFCRDGACVCNAGYTGDPMVECIEEQVKAENAISLYTQICSWLQERELPMPTYMPTSFG
ncbi:uncharacterized protein DEA37_0005498 [Paragonimus westermani]|uniref:EGF-like domain-containing protein n=1 Tax=Paragonimus westermani TaxID=34504 RepID=A0A5J4P301_9TREM|nr:uncharacterized protein DEA37_0005498 [Paragonimus westermani]